MKNLSKNCKMKVDAFLNLVLKLNAYKYHFTYTQNEKREILTWVILQDDYIVLSHKDNTIKDLKKFIKKHREISYQCFVSNIIFIISFWITLSDIINMFISCKELSYINFGLIISELIMIIVEFYYTSLEHKGMKEDFEIFKKRLDKEINVCKKD